MAPMLFWILTTALAGLVAAMLILQLLRARGSPAEANQDVDVYRAQLAEVDRDLERGVLDAQDAERVRTEIGRRLLAADTTGAEHLVAAPRGVTLAMAVVTALALVGGSLWLYGRMGAPGYPDIPLADRIAASEEMRQSRMSQLEAEGLASRIPTRPRPSERQQQLLDELAAVVGTDPGDIGTWTQIVNLAAEAQDFATAARAQQQVLALTDASQDPGEQMRLGILLILAAEGYVSPEAENVLRTVLEADPRNIPARYYYGLLFFETDRPDRAFALFRDIVNEGTPDNPFVQMSANLVEEAAFRAGIDYTLPPPPGPSVDDVTAAMDMSEEDRNAMIADMVNRLSDRLANEGGPAEDWARLINALAVLGDREQARAILLEARTLFATSPEAMEQLNFVATTQDLDE